MARQTETAEDARAQLWTQLEKGFASMLWVEGSDQHPQPMSHFVDREAGVLWYITSDETDLAQAVGKKAKARMTLVSSKQDYHASLQGSLEVVQDEAKLDELWSVPVAAWFEGGREDKHVRLMCFKPQEAAIWASEANRVLVGLKLMRAGMQKDADAPDVGVHHVVEFDNAA